ARPRLLSSAHTRDGTGDVRGGEAQKVGVVVVELAPRADSRNEVAVRLAACGGDLQHRGVLRRFGPRSARQRDAARRACKHHFRFAPQRPRGGACRCAGRKPGGGLEARRSLPRVPAIERDERKVLVVALEHGRGIAQYVAVGRGAVTNAPEVAQGGEPALADDAPGGLADDAEKAPDTPGL